MTESTTAATSPTREYIARNYGSTLKEIFSTASTAWQLMSETKAATLKPSAMVAISPKAAEAHRQTERIRPYICFLFDDQSEGAERKRESIKNAINLIYTFSTSPLPIPIASIGDQNSSLFIKEGDFYGDLELAGNSIEYFLKWKDADGSEKEAYGEEELEGDRIPPKLLYHLYSHLLRA
ncbi:MAG TPA: hypothetical protein VFO86_01855 [Terriglobia bacterium]|nr:hypothetical protein [Terriglobia bacterium]